MVASPTKERRLIRHRKQRVGSLKHVSLKEFITIRTGRCRGHSGLRSRTKRRTQWSRREGKRRRRAHSKTIWVRNGPLMLSLQWWSVDIPRSVVRGHICEIRPRRCLDQSAGFSACALNRAENYDDVGREELHASDLAHVGHKVDE